MRNRTKDGVVVGALAGLALTVPEISTWFVKFLTDTIPEKAILLGPWSIPVYAVLAGIIVGYLVDLS